MPNEDELMVVEQPKTGKKKTQSASSVVDALQGHCAIAKIWVTDFTLCSNPFINVVEVNILVDQAWRHAEAKQKLYAEHPNEACELVIDCSFHPSRLKTDSS